MGSLADSGYIDDGILFPSRIPHRSPQFFEAVDELVEQVSDQDSAFHDVSTDSGYIDDMTGMERPIPHWDPLEDDDKDSLADSEYIDDLIDTVDRMPGFPKDMTVEEARAAGYSHYTTEMIRVYQRAKELQRQEDEAFAAQLEKDDVKTLLTNVQPLVSALNRPRRSANPWTVCLPTFAIYDEAKSSVLLVNSRNKPAGPQPSPRISNSVAAAQKSKRPDEHASSPELVISLGNGRSSNDNPDLFMSGGLPTTNDTERQPAGDNGDEAPVGLGLILDGSGHDIEKWVEQQQVPGQARQLTIEGLENHQSVPGSAIPPTRSPQEAARRRVRPHDYDEFTGTYCSCCEYRQWFGEWVRIANPALRGRRGL